MVTVRWIAAFGTITTNVAEQYLPAFLAALIEAEASVLEVY